MNTLKTAVASLAALSLAACANGYGGSDMGGGQVGGALLGAAAGGYLGSKFGHGKGQLATTAAGTLVGAFVGGALGRNLDQRDQVYHANATERALDYGRPGEPITWNNPETGNYGAVRPGPIYTAPDNSYCREYEQTIYVNGRAERGYGTACRQPDGAWHITG